MLSVLLVAVVLFGLHILVIYPYLLCPLSTIPNAHPLSPLTSIWIQWKRFSGKELEAVNEAFTLKGPVVRLGPNELAVNTMDGGVKTVFGSGFDKPDWYSFWRNHGSLNIFSSLEKKDHTKRRRRISNVFSKTYIQSSPHILKIIEALLYGRLLPQLAQSARTETPIEVLRLDIAYGLDFISALIFGLPRATNFMEDIGARSRWFAGYLRSHPQRYMFWLLEIPNLRRWLAEVGIHVVPKWIWEARERLDEWALEIVDRTEQDIHDVGVDRMQDGDYPVVYNRLRTAMTQDQHVQGKTLRLEIASECLDLLVATRDVFGIAYTFIIHELARRPEAQRDLRNELLSLQAPVKFPATSDNLHLPTPKELESLPLLNAMIRESLRLRGTLPTPFSRVTPHDKKTTIGQYGNIPGGVRISSFAWCLHRNEDVFPSSEDWRPERWLGDEADRMEQEKWFWAFGSGSRMCLANHLSMEMIRYAVAATYTNFMTTIIESEGFNGHGNWVTGKAGDRLILKFDKVGSDDRG